MTTDLASLQRRYVAVAALRWLPIGAMVPVIVVLLRARDVPVATIGPLLALYSAVTILLEVPTGGFADRYGRRRTHLAASAASALGMLMFGVGETTLVFFLSMVPQGIGRALASGPLEAWFVDEAQRVEPEADLSGSFARAESGAALALGAGALLTALLPQAVSLPESGPGLIAPSLPILVATFLEVVHLVAASRLMRPEGPTLEEATTTGFAQLLRAAMTTAAGPVLRRVLIVEFAVATALVATEQVVPTDLVRLLGERDAASLFAVLAAAGFGVVAIGARLAPRLASQAGPRRGYAKAVAGIAVALALGTSSSVPTLAVAYLATYLALGLRTPLRSSLLHARTSSGQRATVLSVVSLVFQLGGLLASLALLPLYSATTPAVAFVVPAFVVAGGALVLGRGPEPAQPDGS